MLILSIESTCDETSVAVVEDGQRVYCNVTFSQIAQHNKTGGVVPEVAARRHVDAIIPVVQEALKQAKSHGITLDKIDAVAVAQGPGLLGCLMVGNNAASALSMMWNKPLIPVHHIEGHLYASWLTDDLEKEILTYNPERDREEKFPLLILTVSGGHNQLILMKDHGKYELLGKTLDDAAGEAFDKVARMLGLGYPGGPEIQKVAVDSNHLMYKLPRAMMKNEHAHDFNFSFSGLKTAMRTLIIKEKEAGTFEQNMTHLAASFEYTICDTLLKKLKKAADLHNPKEIHIAGGVSANLRLRKMLEETFPVNRQNAPRVMYPPLKFCTDNAAMISSVAYFNYMANPEKYSQKWQPSIPDVELKFY